MNDQGPKEISRRGRATIEERFSISVGYIRESGCLAGREVLLEWRRENETASVIITGNRETIQVTWRTPEIPPERQEDRIHIQWAPCNLGGEQPHFECPGCGRRVSDLYEQFFQFRCRHCHDLTYECRKGRTQKLEQRIMGGFVKKCRWDGESVQLIIERPRGMWRRTAEELRRRVETMLQAHIETEGPQAVAELFGKDWQFIHSGRKRDK